VVQLNVGGFGKNWDQIVADFQAWMKDNPDVYYYARPKEDFFESEAYRLAEKAGKTKLILEDMS